MPGTGMTRKSYEHRTSRPALAASNMGPVSLTVSIPSWSCWTFPSWVAWSHRIVRFELHARRLRNQASVLGAPGFTLS